MRSRHTRVVAATILSSFTFASVLAAAPLAARADEEDPGVARIGLLRGDVAVKRADSGDTIAAAINAPLNVGDYLTTERDGRTELQLDNRTALRVGANTQLRFTTMTASSNALQLAAGTVELRLFNGNGAHPEVDTPNATVRPDDSGRYRVSVDADGNTFVTARAGAVDVVTQSSTQTLDPGSTLEISGDGAHATLQTLAALPTDGFDGWNDERDRFEAAAHSYAYTDPNIVGAGDLDHYGTWSDVPGYGEAWRPEYAAGWAPYHDGRWVWEPYYGWTWVSAEPWGWAPYHYGRWFFAGNSWYWYPAVVAYQPPVYQPALVAFFSFGFGGGGLSLGFGNVGWVPLAPYEPFHPWWGRGYGNRTTVVNNVTNITNVTNVTNINHYHNINAPGGAVGVNNASFARGNFNRVVAVTPEQLRGATPVHGVVPVVPTQQNLAYTRASAPLPKRPVTASFDRFTAAKRSAPVRPFVEQQAEVKTLAQRQFPEHAATFEHVAPSQSAGHPLPTAARGITTPAQNARHSTTPVTIQQRGGTASHPVSASAPSDAWQRFNAPTRSAPSSPVEHPAPPSAGIQRAAPPRTTTPGVTTNAWSRFNPSTHPPAGAAPRTMPQHVDSSVAPPSSRSNARTENNGERFDRAPRPPEATHVNRAAPAPAPLAPHNAEHVPQHESDKPAVRTQQPPEHPTANHVEHL